MNLKNTQRTGALALLVGFGLTLSAEAGLFNGPEAQLSQFYKRLESVGLSTDFLKQVEKKIEVFYRKPNSEREAEYTLLSQNIYIPVSYKEAVTRRVRFDLSNPQLDTMIHEFSHAAYRRLGSATAAKGTPAREHYDVIQSIRADLYIDPRHENLIGLPKYPEAKADEICGYFIGASIAEVFSTADEIVFLNLKMHRKIGATDEELEALGDTLVIPEGDDGFVKRIRNKVFGKGKAGNSEAAFEGDDIPWTERGTTKGDIYEHVLGLNPPKDAKALLKNLNTLDNAWIRGVRQQVLAARKAYAAKLRAKVAEAAAAAAPQSPSYGGLYGLD